MAKMHKEAADAEDYMESDDEGADGYRKGGYHPVAVGEVYNGRYQVIAKLGWGHFSTVWLCQDVNFSRFVAMKVQKSAPHYTEAAYDEIELLAEAAKRGVRPEWEATQKGPLQGLFPVQPFTGVVQLIDYFETYGPHGKHVCMVFETMGPNVLALIKRYNFKGIPLDIVRKVTTHTLIGLHLWVWGGRGASSRGSLRSNWRGVRTGGGRTWHTQSGHSLGAGTQGLHS